MTGPPPPPQKEHRRKEKVSETNARLRRPSLAASLAERAVASNPTAATVRASIAQTNNEPPFRVILGLGPGRSGTKSLAELLSAQPGCCRAEHEMIVPRLIERTSDKKGSWGADRRLEWVPPRLVRGAKKRTEDEAAAWRVMRLLEQREAWKGWVKGTPKKPKGARAWREYNKNGSGHGHGPSENANANDNELPVVAATSSVALAYVHEYMVLDPTIRIVVLNRPREEVVASFLKKTLGRNHWQRHHQQEGVQKDKTWDSAFPNMTDEECRPYAGTKKTDKAAAVHAYCEFYESTACELARRYPDNVRIFDMAKVLNDFKEQEVMLTWCGFVEPLLDTTICLNRSPNSLSV